MKLQVAPHSFTNSPVRNLVSYRDTSNRIVSAGTVIPRLPQSTIYGFNGTFPGPMINAEYGKPVARPLREPPRREPLQPATAATSGTRTTASSPTSTTATPQPSRDGNPHYREGGRPTSRATGATTCTSTTRPAATTREKQSFLWFHDHRDGHTGANVYKGMVGLYPIYDPILDPGDETKGLRLPGVRVDNADGLVRRRSTTSRSPSTTAAFDDGVVPHQDFHNGCGESHPEWWGKTFFRHFPNHGFVGDVFTVNGKAYPVLEVKRRKYRLRFLDASISRQFEVSIMKSAEGPEGRGRPRLQRTTTSRGSGGSRRPARACG